jgi:N6-adenosine-specific RNA methylase IME4
LLIATKGAIPVPQTADRPPSVYRERRGKHSAKPEYYRDLIERMYPDLSRIELFARQADRENWDVWGNEV